MLQDNPQTIPASHVDLLAVDALFRRIAERGHKIRAQKQLHKEQTLEPQISMSLTKDNHNTKQAGK